MTKGLADLHHLRCNTTISVLCIPSGFLCPELIMSSSIYHVVCYLLLVVTIVDVNGGKCNGSS